MILRLRTFMLLVVLVSVHTLRGQTPYFPDTVWLSKKPQELKLSAALIDSAIRLAVTSETKTDKNLRVANHKAYANEPNYRILGPMKDRGNPAGVIIYKGYIVGQWGDIDRVDMTFSVTKSYVSTIAGLAYDKRLIRSVDEPLRQHIWDDKFESEHNSKITWRHLLDQSSDWSGCLFDICDWADRPPREGTTDEWKARKLNLPGTRFEYNDVRANLLAYCLLQVWKQPLPVVLRDRIMNPIGASGTWRWYGYENSFVNVDGVMMQSVSAGGHFGGGLFISTVDHARYGLLFARNGKWKNQQLISEQWIKLATTPSTPNKAYGFLWWTNEENRLEGLSKSIYYADGFGGNYIVIDKEQDLVIVARWLDSGKLSELVNLVNRSIQGK